MSLLSRQSRFLTVLCAFVQLALPGTLGVLDAMSARDGRGSVAHIEDTSSKQCRTPHSDDCAVCRYLSIGATKSESAPSVVPHVDRIEPRVFAEADPCSVSHGVFRSRAPPELVS
jgi:hypothetical protein